MAKKEKFVLVSLKEAKAKRIASVLQSSTCRKILDYLAEKNATESELSEKLDIPISTVHYNLKHLMESKLVEAEEFHYSEKGKEVNHYSLSNKYVVIAPRGVSEGFKEKLKNLIPVGLLLAAGVGFIQVFSSFFGRVAGMGSSKSTKLVQGPIFETVSEKAVASICQPSMNAAVQEVGAKGIEELGKGAVTATKAAIMEEAEHKAVAIAGEPLKDQAVNLVTERVIHNQTIKVVTERIVDAGMPYWFWFLIGAVSAIVLYILVDFIRTKFKK